MFKIFNWILFSIAILGTIKAVEIPSDGRTYKDYNILVNRQGIEYKDQTFPCFQPNARCLAVQNDATDFEKYEINVVGDGNAECNQKYQTGKGDLQRTAYSGRCFTAKPTVFLITCRSPPNDPNETKGWIVVKFDQDSTSFTANNGAKARFSRVNNNSVQENPFSTQGTSKEANPNIEAYCST